MKSMVAQWHELGEMSGTNVEEVVNLMTAFARHIWQCERHDNSSRNLQLVVSLQLCEDVDMSQVWHELKTVQTVASRQETCWVNTMGERYSTMSCWVIQFTTMTVDYERQQIVVDCWGEELSSTFRYRTAQ